MDAGKLDKRITLKHVTLTQGSTGEMAKAKAEYATVWAQKIEANQNSWFTEIHTAGADQTFRKMVFRIRKRADVQQSDVVVYSGLEYELVGIREFERSHLDLIISSHGAGA